MIKRRYLTIIILINYAEDWLIAHMLESWRKGLLLTQGFVIIKKGEILSLCDFDDAKTLSKPILYLTCAWSDFRVKLVLKACTQLLAPEWTRRHANYQTWRSIDTHLKLLEGIAKLSVDQWVVSVDWTEKSRELNFINRPAHFFSRPTKFISRPVNVSID